MNAQTTNGNGAQTETTKQAKEPSALAKFLKTLDPKATVNESDKKAAGEAFKKSMGKRAELEKALEDFDKKAQKTVEALIRCYGTKQITVEGVRYVPTSRGERIYYKRMSDDFDTVEI